MKGLLFFALIFAAVIDSSFCEEKPDPYIVPNPGGHKIWVYRSWYENPRFDDELSKTEEPKQVSRDRLHYQPVRVKKPEDRKLHLWIESHIGSEKIEKSATLGPYRLSPLKEFQVEENVPKEYLESLSNKVSKEIIATRISAVPYNGTAISEGEGWRIEQEVKDGRLTNPIRFFLNGTEIYQNTLNDKNEEK